MSKQLEEFKEGFNNIKIYVTKLTLELARNKTNLKLLKNQMEDSWDFSKSPWVELDTKTLAAFKVLDIWNVFNKKINEIISDLKQEENIPRTRETPPPQLTPTQWTQVIDSLQEMTDKAIQGSLKNRKVFEKVIDFLKVCANFFISVIHRGHKPTFYKTTTFELEMLRHHQKNIHQLFEKLSNEEKRSKIEMVGVPEEMKDDLEKLEEIFIKDDKLEANNISSPKMA